MVGVMQADPADAGGLGLLDRHVRGLLDHQMAHAVVAVEQRGGGEFAIDRHVGGRR